MPGFWYPYHWWDMSEEIKVAGQTNDLGEFSASVLGPHAVSMLETRDRYLEDYLNNLSGGMRFATKVVAAHDSLDTAQAHADFVCSGTHDHLTIQQAINALGGNGGKVLLMEGHYNVDGNLGVSGAEIVLGSRVTLEGMGDGTIIQFVNNITSTGGPWLVGAQDVALPAIRNLTLNVNHTHNGSANLGAWFFEGCAGVVVENVTVLDGTTAVNGCFLGLDGVGGTPTTFGRITDCYIVNTFLTVVGDSSQLFKSVLSGNQVSGGQIKLDNCAYVTVIGNEVADFTGFYGIYATNSQLCNIVGNHITNCLAGIFLDNTPVRINVKDNFIHSCLHEGISMFQGTDCVVQDNTVLSCSQASANTYDAIAIGGSTCLRAHVQGNTVRGTTHHDAINVLASSTDALVVNNDLKNGYTTAGFADAGTGTIKNLDGSANNWNRV